MYIQLGNEVSIRAEDIIGVFDINTAFKCKDSNDFLNISDEEGFIHNICNTSIKSVVITEINNNSRIFLSPISSHTLIRRLTGDMN